MKQNFRTIWSLTKTLSIRYARDKTALFFTFLFPLIFLFVFGSIFSGDGGTNFDVAFINQSDTEFSQQTVQQFVDSELFEVDDDNPSFDEAEEKIGRGELDAIIQLPETFGEPINGVPSGTLEVFYDEGDTQFALIFDNVMAAVVEGINQEFIDVDPPFSLQTSGLQTADLSQFDYTLSGLLGFAILSLGIFSMSEGFVADKTNGALRRLQVSPIRAWQLIAATALTRIFVGVLAVALMFTVGLVVFDFNMRGDYISFAVFTVLSVALVFGFGMAIAGWARNADQAAPIANLISFPMMFLSGVFFPTFLMPDFLQSIVAFIPLTPVVDGLRLILTEGKTLLDLGPQLAVMAAWGIAIYTFAFKFFRWE